MTTRIPHALLDQSSNPTMPTGAIVPFAGSTAPGGWQFCAGQAISRTTFATLFAVIGTTYGVGDGSTTFNLPDLRGRVIAGEDDMGGTAANRLNVALTGNTTNSSTSVTALSSTAGLAVGMKVFGTGIAANTTIAAITSATAITLSQNATANGTGVSLRFGIVDGATLGDTGGSHVHTLTTGQLAAHTHPQTGQNGGAVSAGSFFTAGNYGSVSGQATASTGGDQAHPNVQPTIILNYIIRT